MDSDSAPLADSVEAFLVDHDMSPVTFGRLALRDPHFVRDLRGGRRSWPETEQKVRAFMVSYAAPAEQQKVAA